MNPDLLSASLNNRDSLLALFDANQIIHTNIQRILTDAGFPVSAWPMATEPLPDEAWIEHHANEHTAWAQALGIEDPGGLNQYDLSDDAQFSQWVVLHAQHHDLISTALGMP